MHSTTLDLKNLLGLPGAGTIRLEMASSLIEFSVGGGGHTRLSIMSTLRAPGWAEIGGGSERGLIHVCVVVQLFVYFGKTRQLFVYT